MKEIEVTLVNGFQWEPIATAVVAVVSALIGAVALFVIQRYAESANAKTARIERTINYRERKVIPFQNAHEQFIEDWSHIKRLYLKSPDDARPRFVSLQRQFINMQRYIVYIGESEIVEKAGEMMTVYVDQQEKFNTTTTGFDSKLTDEQKVLVGALEFSPPLSLVREIAVLLETYLTAADLEQGD